MMGRGVVRLSAAQDMPVISQLLPLSGLYGCLVQDRCLDTYQKHPWARSQPRFGHKRNIFPGQRGHQIPAEDACMSGPTCLEEYRLHARKCPQPCRSHPAQPIMGIFPAADQSQVKERASVSVHLASSAGLTVKGQFVVMSFKSVAIRTK